MKLSLSKFWRFIICVLMQKLVRSLHISRQFKMAMSSHLLIPPTDAGFKECSEALVAGKLVAFPTETVYGLGANALNAAAVLSIFEAKGRPLTDPLIVHVSSTAAALALVEIEGRGLEVFKVLAEAFWPGPLTLVARAQSHLPSTLSAGTGWVGVRCPKHAFAMRLLVESGVPIAAPSANRFGHVSPTSAEHVIADLGAWPELRVLDGGSLGLATCEVGIESTVCKIDSDAKELVMFRRGGVSQLAMETALRLHDMEDYSIRVLSKKASHAPDAESQQAPGQMLTHYAPDVDTYVLLSSGLADESEGSATDDIDLSVTVAIDFHGSLAHMADKFLAYRDLSSKGAVPEAAAGLFGVLRWTEEVPGAKHVLLPNMEEVDDEHALAVYDRIFRAASGKKLMLARKGGPEGPSIIGQRLS